MNQRRYNIYFHTHTISGIVIAALLYVIFFAGSFSFFKDDITAWQKGTTAENHAQHADYNYIIDSLGGKYNLKGRNFDFYLLRQGNGAYVNMSASQDTTISKPKPKGERRGGRRRGGDDDSAYFLHYFADKTQSSYSDGYNMGEFLYRLHFLAQLNQVPIKIGKPFGYTVAGIVSFLFLFALITGLLLHWDKIKTNFFLFRPWSKWKTVWTDMHTVLGVIGFPFQLLFAITGIVLIVNYVLISPFTDYLYGGKEDKLYEDLQYGRQYEVAYEYQPLGENFDANAFIAEWSKKWKGSDITRVNIRNYGDKSMEVVLESKPQSEASFAGSGYVRVQMATGKVFDEKSPTLDNTYIDGVKSIVYHLHFGDFGGKPLRIVFFILGLMGCAVIISGIMIWLVARDKVNVPAYKRKFNFWAANFFLSMCLAMLPVTAFTFIMVKCLTTVNQSVIYSYYFYSWLLLTIYLVVRRDLTIVNKHTLLLSAALCFGVPIANAVMSNLGLWHSLQQKAYDIFFIDMLFLILGICSLIAFIKVKKQGKPFKILKEKIAT
ncbi:PepSY-associated TM helix domain-containing protein [Sphingobacterium sp. MYb382]|uniref:PepSY-associated TM helix domain-containing protein n=1 Tax=Sphingobacterium sp. MYb382 TaxID=2745278 RepID=UPI0030A8FE46